MPNIPKPFLYGLGLIFLLAAGWFIYADKLSAVAKAPAPAAAIKK